MLRRLVSPTTFASALCAVGASPALAEDLPFVGKWDCGVATFSFREGIYNNGSEDMPIQEVQEGTDGSYTLFFTDDYTITLSGFAGGEMGWLSSSAQVSSQTQSSSSRAISNIIRMRFSSARHLKTLVGVSGSVITILSVGFSRGRTS